MTTMLINGDSNALAVRNGVTHAQSWGKLVADARGHTLVNTAVGGDTTTQMKAHMASDLAQHQPEVVALMISANDTSQGLTVEQSRQNMLDMIDMCDQAGAKVTLYMHAPFFHDGGVWLHGVGKDIYAMMQELGGLPEVQFVDGFSYFTRHLYYSGYNGTLASGSNPVIKALYAPSYANPSVPDWIHMSAFGQKVFVEPTLMNPRACAV